MAHLGTLCKHKVEPLIGKNGVSFTMLGEMTDIQACAFELLRVNIRLRLYSAKHLLRVSPYFNVGPSSTFI